MVLLRLAFYMDETSIQKGRCVSELFKFNSLYNFLYVASEIPLNDDYLRFLLFISRITHKFSKSHTKLLKGINALTVNTE